MNEGDMVFVRILERIDNRKALVVEADGEHHGVLNIKGNLKIRTDGRIRAWVMQLNRDGSYTFGNSYFGKFNISKGIADKYVDAIKRLYDNPDSVKDSDFSLLKGMCNRCLKKDQWDWFTTYKYLGYPGRDELRNFVNDAVVQRNKLRNGDSSGVRGFRSKYHFMLGSIMFHLSEGIEVDDHDVDVPIPSFKLAQWQLLSFESRKNLKIAERVYQKSSRYILMHYFVTLEQELIKHYVQPFISARKHTQEHGQCFGEKYQRTHNILIGKSPFTLGSVRFFGKFVANADACAQSDAIRAFSELLGPERKQFVELCELIANKTVSGLTLTKLRNGLAHGKPEVLSRVDNGTFVQLRRSLLESPDQILAKVLAGSLKRQIPHKSS